MFQKYFKSAKVGEKLYLLSKTIDEVWKTINIPQDNIKQWPLDEGILQLVQIRITNPRTIHGDEGDVFPGPEINLMRDSNNYGPAPLQNYVESHDIFEVVVDILNLSTEGKYNLNSTINELTTLNEAIKTDNQPHLEGNDMIHTPIMTPR